MWSLSALRVPERVGSHVDGAGRRRGSAIIIPEGAPEPLSIWVMLTLMTVNANSSLRGTSTLRGPSNGFEESSLSDGNKDVYSFIRDTRGDLSF